MDHTLKLKLKGRSLIEFGTFIILSAIYIVYPVKEEYIGQALFIGAIIFLFSYLMLERIVAVGRKLIFAKLYAFETRFITKPMFHKGLFDFFIKDVKIKVFLPVADMKYVLQMLSGAGRRNKRRVR